eukprot:CAMPEP_0202861412 /NCGR_PEP_ID=MMETSP1391-20130828/2822_1 /ASSEMBLY_ACC=CAM_ASM_000867 /TAXON_ID=1034604 /ORGANISM="Chlamydomonas leiostraca, Strain SAG 11-49" /LENGTH=191 /DNA_ID=CAMNT_0049540799 /DNA_START=72 /DNA_END=643 /DNA_ORIENTATION=-
MTSRQILRVMSQLGAASRNQLEARISSICTENAVSTSGRLGSSYIPRPWDGVHHRQFATGFSRIAEHEKGQTKFHGYYAGGFYINNVQVPGSVIAQSDMYMMWRPRTMAEVTPESLVFLELVRPTPEVVVVGCGATSQPLPKDVAAYIQGLGMRVEVLDSRNATGYFNVLNEEGRVVVGVLLAADPSLPLA